MTGLDEARLTMIMDVLDTHECGDAQLDCIDGKWVYARLCDCGWHGKSGDHQAHVADALAPLISGWIAEERERIAKAIEWEAGGREAQAHSARDEEVEWFGAKRRLTAETKALRDAAKIARSDT